MFLENTLATHATGLNALTLAVSFVMGTGNAVQAASVFAQVVTLDRAASLLLDVHKIQVTYTGAAIMVRVIRSQVHVPVHK